MDKISDTSLIEVLKLFFLALGCLGIPLTVFAIKTDVKDLYGPLIEFIKWLYSVIVRRLPSNKNRAIKYRILFKSCGLEDQYKFAIVQFMKDLREKITNMSKPFRSYEEILDFVQNHKPDSDMGDTNGFYWLERCKIIFEKDTISPLLNEVIGYLKCEHYLNIDFKMFLDLFLPKLNTLIDEFDRREALILKEL